MRYHQKAYTEENDFIYRRCFEMPTHNTFQLKSVNKLLSRYIDKSNISKYDKSKSFPNNLTKGTVVVDPFSRTSKWSTWTNDLNPEFNTDFNMDAIDFLQMILNKYGENSCDIALLDPPFSTRQLSEMYKSIGLKVGQKDTQIASLYKNCIDIMDKLLKPKSIAIRCGFNTMGFGLTRGYKMIEVLDVTHGGAHNDLLVTVEIKK